jgi:hypothetical protein
MAENNFILQLVEFSNSNVTEDLFTELMVDKQSSSLMEDELSNDNLQSDASSGPCGKTTTTETRIGNTVFTVTSNRCWTKTETMTIHAANEKAVDLDLPRLIRDTGDIIELENPIKSDTKTILLTQTIISSQDVVFIPLPEDEFGTPTIADDFYLMTPPGEFWVYSQYSEGYNQNNVGQGNYSGNEKMPDRNSLLDVVVGSSSPSPHLFITGNSASDKII